MKNFLKRIYSQIEENYHILSRINENKTEREFDGIWRLWSIWRLSSTGDIVKRSYLQEKDCFQQNYIIEHFLLVSKEIKGNEMSAKFRRKLTANTRIISPSKKEMYRTAKIKIVFD